jgi:hypothetical protein
LTFASAGPMLVAAENDITIVTWRGVPGLAA